MRTIRSSLNHFFLGIAVWMGLLSIAIAASSFVPVKLPHGVRIEIPKNWKVMSNDQRVTNEAFVQAIAEQLGEVKSDYLESDYLEFAARYFDETGKVAATVMLLYDPDTDITQEDIRVSTTAEVNELDAELRKLMARFKSLPAGGFTILDWRGTKKRVINGVRALVTEYKRSPTNNNGNFIVFMVNVFNREKSFQMMVSYRENQGFVMRPICEKIISSLRI
jgi:hypothetical protein